MIQEVEIKSLGTRKFDQKAKLQLIFIIAFPWCNVISEKIHLAPSELVEVKFQFYLPSL